MSTYVLTRYNKETKETEFKKEVKGSRSFEWTKNISEAKSYTYGGAFNWAKKLSSEDVSGVYEYSAKPNDNKVSLFDTVVDERVSTSTPITQDIIEEPINTPEESKTDVFEELIKSIESEEPVKEKMKYSGERYVVHVGTNRYGVNLYLVFFNDTKRITVSPYPSVGTKEKVDKVVTRYKSTLPENDTPTGIRDFNISIIPCPKEFMILPVIS